jgi:hypothetical protein
VTVLLITGSRYGRPDVEHATGFTLVRKGVAHEVLVDAIELPRVTSLGPWHIHPTQSGRLYVARGRSGCRLYLHRVLMGDPSGFVVDHINGNGLDNRVANLRVATVAENSRNQRPRGSRWPKGVYLDSFTGRFKAQITFNRKCLNLGRFDTPEEAHSAYCKAAAELHREFARSK